MCVGLGNTAFSGLGFPVSLSEAVALAVPGKTILGFLLKENPAGESAGLLDDDVGVSILLPLVEKLLSKLSTCW